MIKEIQPGFICFSSAITEKGEDLEKNPSVSVIMRVERVDVDEKTLLGLKRIQQKAAAEVDALLGWTGGELLLARSKGGEPEPPAGPHLRFQNGRVADGTEAGEPTRPEPMVKLGPGASFRLENTPIHGQYPVPEGVKVEVVERLQNLCSFCKEMESYRNGDSRDAGKQYGAIRGRAWGIDVVMLEFAISVLSELREIKEVRIPAQTDTPGVWELMRDILAGKRPAPEGAVFDVVIDMTGNPQAIKRRGEPEHAQRMLAISMPGGETVKLNSAAEAYRLAACIEEMAARVWPEAVPGK